MKAKPFYICPYCFEISDHAKECHGHRMVCCYPGAWGDARRKPIADDHGVLLSSAPRWYLEARGWAQAAGHYTPLPPR